MGLPSRLTLVQKALPFFHKVLENKNPKYLFSLIPTRPSLYLARNTHDISLVNTKKAFSKSRFFHQLQLNGTTRILILENLRTFRCLKAIFLSSYDQLFTIFITPEKSIFIMLNRLCSWGNGVESTEYFIIHCPQFVKENLILLITLSNLNCSLLENTSKVLTQTLNFGNTSLSPSNSSKILSATTDFILSTKRFDEQLI